MARKPDNYSFPTAGAFRTKLDAHLIEGFTEIFLLDRYDSPKPIPDFHRRLWTLFCDPSPFVAVAAPRGHAKSSAGTHAYGLANAVFGAEDFILVISATEAMSADHLANMAVELEENEGLIETFKIKVLTSNETELIARCNGREFCIIAKGAEQKVRGLKWRNKRPGLILIDDLEEDEAVMSFERRDKLSKWMLNALLPVGSDDAKFRMVGTILHLDSQLERFLNDPEWLTERFRAHSDFDDFTDILWPEKFTEARLRRIRQSFVSQSNASGYSQEYLSHPIAEIDAYFRRSDFPEMLSEDYRKTLVHYAAIDFAVSKKERADNTAIAVGGMDCNGVLNLVDVRAEKLDSLEIVELMFEIEQQYKPAFWIVEEGVIEKTLGPFLRAEMVKRGIYLNIVGMTPTQDKQARARSFQARTRAGGVRYAKVSDWYYAYEQEMLSFPRGIHDDRVDASAWLGLGLDKFWDAATPEEEQEDEFRELEAESSDNGRSNSTGY